MWFWKCPEIIFLYISDNWRMFTFYGNTWLSDSRNVYINEWSESQEWFLTYIPSQKQFHATAPPAAFFPKPLLPVRGATPWVWCQLVARAREVRATLGGMDDTVCLSNYVRNIFPVWFLSSSHIKIFFFFVYSSEDLVHFRLLSNYIHGELPQITKPDK